jgi:hypothetical protein
MEPFTLALAAARLIAGHGDDLLDASGDLASKLVAKGTDALAGTAVAGLIGWLKARSGDKRSSLEESSLAAVTTKDDANIDALARDIQAIACGAERELQTLVDVAGQAAACTITNIQFGEIKAGVFVAGGTAIVPGQNVTFS